MRCIFTFMDIKISLSSQNSNLICYCISYFKNYFNCFDEENGEVTMSVDIIDHSNVGNNYVLETKLPFKVFIHKYDKKMVLTGVKDENCHELMRLIRELFVYYISTSKKCSFFHAACVTNNKYAVAITGNKFAGKTTMCFNFLRNGWNFISNDKLILEKNERNEIICWGLPIALGVREGTKQIFTKELDGLAIDSKDNRYYLSPNQLIERFNIRVVNKQQLKLILVPVFCPEAQKINCEKIEINEVLSILKNQSLESFSINRKNIKSLKTQSNYSFINCLCKIPVYRILINTELNYQFKKTIEKIIKQEVNQYD